MLTLNGVSIHLQSFGSILCIHLTGPSMADIEARYWSFYNHQTSGGEMEWENDVVSPYHSFFWVYSGVYQTAEDKVILGLIRGAMFEMLPPNSHASTKGRDIWPEACAVGVERFGIMDHVTWLDIRTEIDFGAGYSFGDAVHAEKGTGNFDDEVLAKVVTRGGNATLDMVKAKTNDNEESINEQFEEASVSEDL